MAQLEAAQLVFQNHLVVAGDHEEVWGARDDVELSAIC